MAAYMAASKTARSHDTAPETRDQSDTVIAPLYMNDFHVVRDETLYQET